MSLIITPHVSRTDTNCSMTRKGHDLKCIVIGGYYLKKNEKQKNTLLSEVTKFNSKIVHTEVKIDTSSTHS